MMFLWFCSAKSGFGWLWFIRSILMEQLRFGSFEFRWYVSYRPSLLGSTARFKDCHLNVRWNDISVKLVLKHKSFLWFSMRSTNFFSLYEKMKGNPVGDWCSSLKRIVISLFYNYTLIFLVSAQLPSYNYQGIQLLLAHLVVAGGLTAFVFGVVSIHYESCLVARMSFSSFR